MINTLLVEGVDDQEVVRQLLRHYGFSLDPEDRQKILRHSRLGELDVRKTGGYPSILEELSVYIKSRGGFHVGIILDRDGDGPQQANPWPSIRHRVVETLPELETTLPQDLDSFPKEGLVARIVGGRRLGVWLMPDNRNLGMLETFVATLIPSSNRLWPLAQSAVKSIPNKDRRFAEQKRDKACIHTWLAWQVEPGVRMGTAINNHYLDHNSSTASAFIRWIETLIAPISDAA